jgi:predicted nucleic acid-binding Zn ribbon protein
MGFDSLLDILKLARSKHPALGKRINEAEALVRWETAVGPVIAKHTRAIRVQDSILWVEVDHPIWKSELHHRKRQILELLNQGREEDSKRGKKAMSAVATKDVVKDILFLDPRSFSSANKAE